MKTLFPIIPLLLLTTTQTMSMDLIGRDGADGSPPPHHHLPAGFKSELESQTTGKHLSQQLIEKRVISYTNAVSMFHQMLKKMNMTPGDVPTLNAHFAHGKNFLFPVHTVTDIFTGAETEEDVAMGLLRLGMTSHNTGLLEDMPADVSPGDLHNFGADCYYFSAQWLYHSLAPVFKEANTLLPTHHTSAMPSYFKTIQGRKDALEGALSVLKVSNWSLFRMGEDDHRRYGMEVNVKSMNALISRFYKSWGTAMPGVVDILKYGNGLEKLVAKLTLHDEPATESDLLAEFYKAYVAHIAETLDEGDEPTFLKLLGEALYPGDIAELFHILYTQNLNYFYQTTVPEYRSIYEQIGVEVKKLELI